MFLKKFFSSLFSILTCTYRNKTKKKREKIQNTGAMKKESDISEISGLSEESDHSISSVCENDTHTTKESTQKDNYSEAVLSFYSEHNNEKELKSKRNDSNEYRSLNKRQSFDNISEKEDSSSIVSLDSPKPKARFKKIQFNNKSNHPVVVDDEKNSEKEILLKMKRYLKTRSSSHK